jgi:hypothetical protein
MLRLRFAIFIFVSSFFLIISNAPTRAQKLTPGNLLVGTLNTLKEYTPTGTLDSFTSFYAGPGDTYVAFITETIAPNYVMDIQPGMCPNRMSPGRRDGPPGTGHGPVLPVAIFGTEEAEVALILLK